MSKKYLLGFAASIASCVAAATSPALAAGKNCPVLEAGLRAAYSSSDEGKHAQHRADLAQIVKTNEAFREGLKKLIEARHQITEFIPDRHIGSMARRKFYSKKTTDNLVAQIETSSVPIVQSLSQLDCKPGHEWREYIFPGVKLGADGKYVKNDQLKQACMSEQEGGDSHDKFRGTDGKYYFTSKTSGKPTSMMKVAFIKNAEYEKTGFLIAYQPDSNPDHLMRRMLPLPQLLKERGKKKPTVDEFFNEIYSPASGVQDEEQYVRTRLPESCPLTPQAPKVEVSAAESAKQDKPSVDVITGASVVKPVGSVAAPAAK